MPIEDGMRKAAKNLDKVADAAPTSKVVHATDRDEQHEKDRTGTDDVTQNGAEDQPDESDD